MAKQQQQSFNKRLQSHYLEQQLSEQQRSRLRKLQVRRTGSVTRYLLATAATIVVVIGGYFYPSSTDNYASISQQIAYNHNAKLQMEVLAPTINEVQGRLNRLGFSLISSSKIDTHKWLLIGGRYCNIDGKIAAQIKYSHPETKAIYTVYQVKVSSERLESLTESATAIDGVNVKLWREKGLLMGLAF